MYQLRVFTEQNIYEHPFKNINGRERLRCFRTHFIVGEQDGLYPLHFLIRFVPSAII